ncbi:MAG: bifunctional (p)ppGpp synthetase/guanosine-3',5'-bis(diphosphate) 3'-pyrophosphohydrolase [Clostridiales bacterium]|nr:bifunctional (p)ppGpp synthetase/guanosine-3',5'-bis(diphosphate) 3'-pyrophosphohydrolase [Clostridiales bacterium]
MSEIERNHAEAAKIVEREGQHLRSRYVLMYSDKQVEMLDSALRYAVSKHDGQFRISGEPYITHPIAVANLLLDIGLDSATIAAALLHDCIEDTSATDEEITALFGSEVCMLVTAVTKLEKMVFKSKEEEQAENFRRMFFAMAKDIRVILVKLADRLHNMRTIGALKPERQIAMATETLDIYAPLASRLGLSFYKCELDDLCLKTLHPEAYTKLVNEVSLKRAERQDLVNHICETLRKTLKDLNINGQVSGRPKHFYSIYKKMVQQNKTFEQIYDLTAVRVIVDSVRDCYEVLGVIHTMWKPIPGRFKDYIAVPKPNNYQSLHTTVMTNYGAPFEIQIRTFEMHKIAEYGIAAHWKYKENRMVDSDLDEKLEWLRGVMETEKEQSADPEEFYDSFKLDLYSGQVFVFTPRGDVLSLPEGATPIDFAYTVHSEVGNKCVGAKVNNKIVPLETKLQTGDYVDIITSQNSKGPSRDWLRFVKTSTAKSKIRSFFKHAMKEENIKHGKELLEKEAKNRGYALNDLLNPKWLEVIMLRYSFSSINDMYASVGYGAYTPNQILLKLIDFYRREHPAEPNQFVSQASTKNSDGRGIIVDGHTDMLVRIAKCCSPVPGDNIIGYISCGRGVTIHRSNCPNIKNAESFRLIEAHWNGKQSAPFSVSLTVECKNSGGVLARITKLISDMKISIESLSARPIDKTERGVISLNVRVSSPEQLELVINKIQSVRNVDKVYRKMN